MGQAVEAAAQRRGHTIVARLDRDDHSRLGDLHPGNTDVVVEFTQPGAFMGNLAAVMDQGLPLVTGTTGWLDQLPAARDLVQATQGSLLYSSNFSVGVNILFALNRRLAQLMNAHPGYDCFIEERHHRHKADAPSGTARSLAEQVIAGLDRKTRIAGPELRERPPQPEELSVGYVRSGEITGTHRVSYTSPIDTLSIEHTAHSREGFAEGAVIAAEWLPGRPGVFDFAELFAD